MINKHNAVSLNDKKAFYKNEIENISAKIYNKEQKQLAISILDGANEHNIDSIYTFVTQRVKLGFTFDAAPEVNHSAVSLAKHSTELSFGTLGTKHKMIIGENYDALKNLLVTHREKIDVIYIDPPYNTEASRADGNDHKSKEITASKFVYRDKFTRNGWLNMMQERLKLARQLLSESGVIFISIDDNEQAYLKVLCDEIFGEENFVNQIIWYYSAMSSKPKNSLRSANEYILMYAKQKESFVLNDLKESKMKNRNIINTIENLSKHYNFGVNDAMAKLGYEFDQENQDWFSWYAKDTKDYFTNTIDSVWYVPVVNRMAHEYIPEFNNQKPTTLIKKILKISSTPNSTILDFFAGSGTTGQAVMELNEEDGGGRQCILVTNNENGIAKNITRERLYRVCNGVGTNGETFKWQYSKEKPYLENNIWDIFEIETHELKIDDYEKAEELLADAEKQFKLLNENYQHRDFDLYNQLASLNPYKK